MGYAIHRVDGKIVDHDDMIGGIVLLQKGDDSDKVLDGLHAKIEELNDHILPPGVKIVPYLDRSDLLHYTTHTVTAQPDGGHHPCRHHPVFFSGQYSRRTDRIDNDPVCTAFRFASVSTSATFQRIFCRWARWILAWWWTARW